MIINTDCMGVNPGCLLPVNAKARAVDDRRYARSLLAFRVAVFLFLSAITAEASTYLGINDDSYLLFSRLEAEGVVNSGLLSTKPISRNEAKRLLYEAETNAEGRSIFIKDMVRELRERIQPEQSGADNVRLADSVYAKYIHTTAEVLTPVYPPAVVEREQAFSENNDGDLYSRGSNVRTGFVSRIEDQGPFSLYLNPELRSTDRTEKVVLKKGYAVLGASWIDIVAGRDSQWWGPGFHGALLLSDNAEPLTMVRITGPGPVALPWIFKYLGSFQYNIFVTRLEKNRTDVPEPYLWGMRFDFKPIPNIEIGFERTALLGGRGRPQRASTWADSFFGTHEHSDAAHNIGDQMAGYDVKLTLPFRLQPVQIYWEEAGEENRQYTAGLPYKLADIYGIYLPRLLGLERISLRAEYASNHVSQSPYIWYTDGVYSAGYTYNGMIIGHQMGTDSRDLFLELACALPEKKTRLSLSFDQETHNVAGPVSEIVRKLALTARFPLSDHVEVKATGGYGRITNPGNVTGPALYVNEFSSEIRYLF